MSFNKSTTCHQSVEFLRKHGGGHSKNILLIFYLAEGEKRFAGGGLEKGRKRQDRSQHKMFKM